MARVLMPLRQQLSTGIRGALNKADASAVIDHVVKMHAQDHAIANALFVPISLAHLAGQISVHGVEAKLVHASLGDFQSSGAFLGKPWQDAVDAFRARGIVSDAELSKLMRDYADQSVEARSLMLERIQTRVHELLAQALENEQTFGAFADNLATEADGLGISLSDDSYLQTVFRTNVQSAYGAGRFKSFMDPAVQEARPFVQYRTVGDARVRPTHAVLDRGVYRIDDPVWQRIAPPNGYNCRCSMVTLSEEEASGHRVRDSLPRGYEPEPGFDGPPLS